jgi:hypothetical protein
MTTNNIYVGIFIGASTAAIAMGFNYYQCNKQQKRFIQQYGKQYIREKSITQILNPDYDPKKNNCGLALSSCWEYDLNNPTHIDKENMKNRLLAENTIEKYYVHSGISNKDFNQCNDSLLMATLFPLSIPMFIDKKLKADTFCNQDHEFSFKKFLLIQKIADLPDLKHIEYTEKALSHNHKQEKIN